MEVSSTTSTMPQEQYPFEENNNLIYDTQPPRYSHHLQVDINENHDLNFNDDTIESSHIHYRYDVYPEDPNAPVPTTEEILMAMSAAAQLRDDMGRQVEGLEGFYGFKDVIGFRQVDPTMLSSDSSSIVVDIHHDTNQQLLLQELQVEQPGLQFKLDEMEAIEDFDADGPFVTAESYAPNYNDFLIDTSTLNEADIDRMDTQNWPETWTSLNVCDIEQLCTLDDLFHSWSEALPDMVMPPHSEGSRDAEGSYARLVEVPTSDMVLDEMEKILDLPSMDLLESNDEKGDVTSQNDELEGIQAAVNAFQNDLQNSPQETQKVWSRKCDICGMKLLGGRHRYEAHIQNCHQWTCLCGIEYKFKQTLTKHIETEGGEQSSCSDVPVIHGIKIAQRVRPLFECDVCDDVFRTSHAAVKHRKQAHNIVDEAPPIKCNFCKEVLKSKRALQRHGKSCPSREDETAAADSSEKKLQTESPTKCQASVGGRRPRRLDMGIKVEIPHQDSTNPKQAAAVVAQYIKPIPIPQNDINNSLEPKIGLVAVSVSCPSSNSEVTSSSGSSSVYRRNQDQIKIKQVSKPPSAIRDGNQLVCQSTTDSCMDALETILPIPRNNAGAASCSSLSLSQGRVSKMIPISQGFQVLRRGSESTGSNSSKPLGCGLCKRQYFCKKSLRCHMKNIHNITTDYLSHIDILNPAMIRLIPSKVMLVNPRRTEETSVPCAKKRKKCPEEEAVTSSSDLSFKNGTDSNSKHFKMSNDSSKTGNIKASRSRKGKSYPPDLLKSILTSSGSERLKTHRVSVSTSSNKPLTVNVINNPPHKELSKSNQPKIKSGKLIYILDAGQNPTSTSSLCVPNHHSLALPKFDAIRKSSNNQTASLSFPTSRVPSSYTNSSMTRVPVNSPMARTAVNKTKAGNSVTKKPKKNGAVERSINKISPPPMPKEVKIVKFRESSLRQNSSASGIIANKDGSSLRQNSSMPGIIANKNGSSLTKNASMAGFIDGKHESSLITDSSMSGKKIVANQEVSSLKTNSSMQGIENTVNNHCPSSIGPISSPKCSMLAKTAKNVNDEDLWPTEPENSTRASSNTISNTHQQSKTSSVIFCPLLTRIRSSDN